MDPMRMSFPQTMLLESTISQRQLPCPVRASSQVLIRWFIPIPHSIPIPSQACGLYYLNLLEDIVIKQWGYTGIHISCYIIILYPIMAIQISCITVTQGLRPSTFCCQRVFSSSRFALHDSSAYTWHLEKFKAWLAKRHGKITPFLDKIHPQTKKTGTKIE